MKRKSSHILTLVISIAVFFLLVVQCQNDFIGNVRNVDGAISQKLEQQPSVASDMSMLYRRSGYFNNLTLDEKVAFNSTTRFLDSLYSLLDQMETDFTGTTATKSATVLAFSATKIIAESQYLWFYLPFNRIVREVSQFANIELRISVLNPNYFKRFQSTSRFYWTVDLIRNNVSQNVTLKTLTVPWNKLPFETLGQNDYVVIHVKQLLNNISLDKTCNCSHAIRVGVKYQKEQGRFLQLYVGLLTNSIFVYSVGPLRPQLVLYTFNLEEIVQVECPKRSFSSSSSFGNTNSKYCSRQPFNLPLRTFDNRLLAPLHDLDMGLCSGTCLSLATNYNVNKTNNAILRNWYLQTPFVKYLRTHGLFTDDIVDAQCAPGSYRPIFLYFVMNSEYIIKRVDNLLVESCRCI